MMATREGSMRSKFDGVYIENSILRGLAKFETTEEGTDLSGRFNILIKTNKSDFFIGLKPRNHLIIRSSAGLTRSLTRIISGILYGEEMGHRLKLTDNQDF